MKKQNYYLGVSILSAAVLLFQNCSGGFRLQNDELNDATLASTAGVDVHEASFSELEPYSYKFTGSESLSFPEDLPPGAFYDPQTRGIYWIPAKGQRGDYSFNVQESGVVKFHFTFHVLGLDESKLRYGGPPFHYQDGDVGYIFVHGAQDKDLCADRSSLDLYWGKAPLTLAPDSNLRYLTCYDGRKAVADVAESVARQIMDAQCGLFKKCIIVTHSMGGLLMEHMFLHARPPTGTDQMPSWYLNRALYQSVREKTLFVISLASAAGGSKTADVAKGNTANLAQEVVGVLSRWMGADLDSTANLMVAYASRVVAPFQEDPGMPFFMVPGYTTQTLYEATGVLGSLVDTLTNSIPDKVFNGNRELTLIDQITSFSSRSDGLVDFRSSCGIASADYNDGVAENASLDDHFHYCWGAPKKANHYLWFAVNLNHALITLSTSEIPECSSSENPCQSRFPASIGTLVPDESFKGMGAIDVIRSKVGSPVPMTAP
ncbi:MAG: hypothetical protein ACXVB1_06170, partial [Pseudobdellovibrionaceae bacterium]